MKKLMVCLIVLILAACGSKGGGGGGAVDNSRNSSSSTSSSTSTSSTSSNGGGLPTISVLNTYTVDENSPFTLLIKATGVEPFKFQLDPSPDAAFFKLDPITGELTNKALFDFEAPQSVSGGNTYSLAVQVTDGLNRSTTKNITIGVNNKNEQNLVVDFPINGANMGAAASKVNVRGRIAENGQIQSKIPAGLAVRVNGVTAKVDPALPGSWKAEVPLVRGENTLDVELVSGNQVENEKILRLDNFPVYSHKVANGVSDFFIEIDADRKSFYKRSYADKTQYALLASNNQGQFAECAYFSRVSLNQSGTRLAALCNSTVAFQAKLISCNLNGGACEFVSQVNINGADFLSWADDRTLVYPMDASRLGLVNLDSKSVKTLDLGDAVFINRLTRVYIDNLQVVIFDEVNPSFGAVGNKIHTFELQSAIDSSELVYKPILTPFTHIPLVGKAFFYYNRTIYALDVLGLVGYNLDTAEVTDKKIARFPIENSGADVLVHASGELSIYQKGSELFSYNLLTGEIKDLFKPNNFNGRLESDLSPDGKQLALFDAVASRVMFYDTLAGSVSSTVTVPHPPEPTGESFGGYNMIGSVSVDWGNEILYRSMIGGGSGVEPDATPLITAYNLKTKVATVIATAQMLHNQIGLSLTKIRAGNIVYIADTNELIINFSLTDGFITEQVIASFNPGTQQLKTMARIPAERKIDNTYLSRYNPAFKGLFLSHWGLPYSLGGGVDRFDFSGSITPLLEPKIPYDITTRGAISPNGKRYYGVGLKRSNTYQGFEVAEVFSIDLTTNIRTVIAAEGLGNGFAPTSLELMYDSNRDVLIDYSYDNLWFVDTVTGDRVVKPVEVSKSN